MTNDGASDHVDAVRRFNRFYTRRIGVLGEGHLDTPFSLTEARVAYELAQRGTTTATELGQELGLDAGYLSRILRGFQERGLIDRRPSEADARQTHLSLTDAGRAAFAQLDSAARRDVGAMLGALPSAEQDRLVRAMRTIESLLDTPVDFTLREPRPDDKEWLVWRHQDFYMQEYGWGEKIAQHFAARAGSIGQNNLPERERGWIAEVKGSRAGCVFLTCSSNEIAQLRMLLVDPAARGLGIGTRLVDECVRFARAAGYRKITLTTNEILSSAQRLFAAAGFHMVDKEEQPERGPADETWELDLQRARPSHSLSQ